MRFHTQTGGVTLQAQQPLNNVVRVTVQALAAVLGGTQSLHTNGYDEALALPSAESATLALRTQQVLGYESGVADVVDPLAGSFYVESLTDAIEGDARRLIAEVDEAGGAARAIERGFFQDAIARSAYELQKAQESGERVVVGVNRFTDQSAPLSMAAPDFSVLEQQQRARLADTRRGRDPQLVNTLLDSLTQAAAGSGRLMPLIIDAVKARATLGEISDTLRAVWGVYRPT
jgi:methylmalonyl-CoA mutase N-terminal domain/subunit